MATQDTAHRTAILKHKISTKTKYTNTRHKQKNRKTQQSQFCNRAQKTQHANIKANAHLITTKLNQNQNRTI